LEDPIETLVNRNLLCRRLRNQRNDLSKRLRKLSFFPGRSGNSPTEAISKQVAQLQPRGWAFAFSPANLSFREGLSLRFFR